MPVDSPLAVTAIDATVTDGVARQLWKQLRDRTGWDQLIII